MYSLQNRIVSNKSTLLSLNRVYDNVMSSNPCNINLIKIYITIDHLVCPYYSNKFSITELKLQEDKKMNFVNKLQRSRMHAERCHHGGFRVAPRWHANGAYVAWGWHWGSIRGALEQRASSARGALGWRLGGMHGAPKGQQGSVRVASEWREGGTQGASRGRLGGVRGARTGRQGGARVASGGIRVARGQRRSIKV